MFSCLIVFIFNYKRNKVSSYAFSQSRLPVCSDVDCVYGSKELVNLIKSEYFKCSLMLPDFINCDGWFKS